MKLNFYGKEENQRKGKIIVGGKKEGRIGKIRKRLIEKISVLDIIIVITINTSQSVYNMEYCRMEQLRKGKESMELVASGWPKQFNLHG